ncbi:MAG: hypothetical protein FWH21_07275 [Kiritimatiellaeota bacterium]|nr:hypothetical protein [Kiritimatiellota bacterium]
MGYEVMEMNAPLLSVLDKVLYFLMWALPFVLLAILLAAVCVLWKMLKVQRGIGAALVMANRINAEMLEAIKDIGNVPTTNEAEGTVPGEEEEEQEEKGRGEAPADFVYCPECSTRVEVDPFIRNINVVCPDCKKPFHIH